MGAASKNNLKAVTNIFDTTVNACKLESGFASSVLLKLVYTKLNKYSNITFSCPFKKVEIFKNIKTLHKIPFFQGFYQITNYETDDEGIPLILVRNKLLFLEASITGRVKNHRKTSELINFKSAIEFK